MWGTLLFSVALCLFGNAGTASGTDVMGQLHWCSTLCMCVDSSQVEVQCFARSDIYELLRLREIQVVKLERINWKIEEQLEWCNNTCLCHQNNNQKVFKCAEEDTLRQFISDRIGDEYFHVETLEGSERDPEGEVEEEEKEEEAQMTEHRKRSEERRKNRKNRKQGKRVKNRQELPRVMVTDPPTTTTTTTSLTTPAEVVEEEVTSPPTEAVVLTTPPRIISFLETPAPILILQSSGLPIHASSTHAPIVIDQLLTTREPPFQPYHSPIDTNSVEEYHGYGEIPEEEEEEENQLEDYEEEAELLPKQEAVAASPAVTAMQPPTRHQPYSPTASSHAGAPRDAETLAPKVSAVLEVPVQRKTVASEVSQDLDELGSAVLQIKSDVVLNQRILLVTVAVAGIAMLGVLVLAVHSCAASKRQAAAEEKRQKELPKEDNHVTKVNLEEAW